MIAVLDASAAVEVILRRKEARAVHAALVEAERVFAPDLYVAELANALWKYSESDKHRSSANELLDDGVNLPDEYVPSTELYREALSFSIRTHHPVYDSLYLILARRQSATLLTLDRRLAALAAAEGLRVLPEQRA